SDVEHEARVGLQRVWHVQHGTHRGGCDERDQSAADNRQSDQQAERGAQHPFESHPVPAGVVDGDRADDRRRQSQIEQRGVSQQQPWIDELIFAPARAAGRTVLHLDAKSAEGVDIVADLSDRLAISGLAAGGFRSILCSNLLEHVVDRTQIALALLEIVPQRGYLFVSGPYRYPLHPDPIDSMFRPTPRELAGLFPGTRLQREAIIKNGRYLDEF